MKMVKNFWNDESGLELSEYAVAAALIAIAVAAAFSSLGNKIKDALDALTDKIKTA